MSVRGYVLITAIHGETRRVLDWLSNSPGVLSAEAVSGPYDIIAIVEAEDVDGLGRTVTDTIQDAKGIDRTLTSVVMKL